MLVTIASFVFVLGILIFIHELGHFLVAKKVGIRVETFSLGFPPNIFSKKFGDTVYAIGIIPLGGFVKMAGENPDEKSTGSPDEFMAKSVGQRAAVIFAGPFMNYLLAIFIMVGIFYLTGKPIYEQGRIIVGQVVNDDPAQKAGLKENDQIIALNGIPVTNYDSLRLGINAVVKKPIELTWIHQNDTITKDIVTKAEHIPNMNGGIDTIGLVGFNQKPIRY
ncbi:MAG TPA: site-2 protease family protein, partial [candidate division Zixibacteria bacterium]|nr:site-2 protease family protein [candidate division Zixibacteria bacterium]